ncbi:hypothetical protein [Parasphingopyxis sp.]|nr:hypothetical protein [Parasphingopyxis sp.]
MPAYLVSKFAANDRKRTLQHNGFSIPFRLPQPRSLNFLKNI